MHAEEKLTAFLELERAVCLRPLGMIREIAPSSGKLGDNASTDPVVSPRVSLLGPSKCSS